MDFNRFNNFVIFLNYFYLIYDNIRYFQNRASTLKKQFILNHDKPIKVENINHAFHFSTNLILKKVKKKIIRKIKGLETKKNQV